jgi:hypothetical protein
MSMNTELTQEVKGAIVNLLQQRMDRYGFERATINAGEDHSGDPALFIDAFYHLSQQPLETAEILRLLTEIRDLLVHRLGESRFPHIRHHFDAKQEVLEYKRSKK